MPSKTEPVFVFAGYRDWAVAILDGLRSKHRAVTLRHADTPEKLAALINGDNPAAVLMAGWSWILPNDEVEKQPIYGLHPSDLPAYAGGSPIQHQIIDGVTESKVSIFRLCPGVDSGPIINKADLSLNGHLDEIFDRITECGIGLFADIMTAFPDVSETPQPPVSHAATRRLRPEDSRLEKSKIAELTCRDLFNLIRAREDPYPNVFIEDETGRLSFKRVEFDPADNSDT
jgi:methionyl-tRNA formyltransferase